MVLRDRRGNAKLNYYRVLYRESIGLTLKGVKLTRKEEYEYLLRRSKEFYKTAAMQLEEGFYGLAAFSLEQSL